MIVQSLQEHIKLLLADHIGSKISSIKFIPVGGGSINNSYQIITNTSEIFFCKINDALRYPSMFKKEKNGLELLLAQHVIRVPVVICVDEAHAHQILIMECIEQGRRNENFWELFGKQLAALHSIKGIGYGLHEDNYMGALTQYNKPHNNWVDFFIQQRLQPQIKLARESHFLNAQHILQFENVYKKLPTIFPVEKSSLLHGDLWSGNFLCGENNEPVLIDPAVYYGHSSIDMAMTTLFGGFDEKFYQSYTYYRPLSPNYRQQWEVCNLYPLLIHLNLFGKGYLQQILNTINQY